METCRFGQKKRKWVKENWRKREKKKGRGKRVKRDKIGERIGKLGEAEDKGKERTREKGRLGSPEGHRPVTCYGKRRWNFACHVPSTFARKATMFEPPQKTKNRQKNKKNAKLSRANTGSSPQMLLLSAEMAPSQAQKATYAHHCTTIHKNATKHHHHCPKTPRKCHEPQQKHDKLMSKIDQKRVLYFRKVSGSKN